MDKRWLLILIILILGTSCSYVIVNNSLTVGSASQSVGHAIISIPPDFTTYSSDSNSVSLVSSNGHKIEFAEIQNNDTAEKLHDYRISTFNKTKEIHTLQDGVVHVGDTDVYTIYYHADKTDSQDEINSSLSYFDKFDHTYFIRVWGFDYEKDYNTTMDYITLISTNIRLDYKQ